MMRGQMTGNAATGVFWILYIFFAIMVSYFVMKIAAARREHREKQRGK